MVKIMSAVLVGPASNKMSQRLIAMFENYNDAAKYADSYDKATAEVIQVEVDTLNIVIVSKISIGD